MAGYNPHGKAFFRHKNHFHKPASAIPESLRSQILQIYNADYYDAKFSHFHESKADLSPTDKSHIPCIHH